MGRRKIIIRPITDQKLRHTTFNKRKNGLIKKAAELSMLCDLKLLLVFEDTSGALIQYSTHGIFNQFEYFTNFMEEKIIQFSTKDYPNFFKVNHYKKNSKVTTKELEKQQTRSDKLRKQALIIPKIQEKNLNHNSSIVEDSPVIQKRELSVNEGNYGLLDPSKTESQLSNETGLTQTPENHLRQSQYQSEIKKKNHKNLSIAIPNKNKFLEYQMNVLKNPTNAPTHLNTKLQSPHTYNLRMQSPLMKPVQSPALKSNNSKQGSTFTRGLKPGPGESPNLFFGNDYFFQQNYQDPKTPDLPSFLDPQNIQGHTNQMAQMTPAQMNHQQLAMNSQMNQNVQLQQQQQQLSAQMSMNPVASSNATNVQQQQQQQQQQTQGNTPNTMSVNTAPFKLGGFFDSLDSPYTKYNFNQKLFYPFMGFNAGTGVEEGFSPFLKTNMSLDYNNTNSNIPKRDSSTIFTFKNEPGSNGKGDTYASTDTPGDSSLKNEYVKSQNNFEEKMRPKKKLKVA